MISQIARIQTEETHHDDTRPLAVTVTARSEEREQRRHARLEEARGPFQSPIPSSRHVTFKDDSENLMTPPCDVMEFNEDDAAGCTAEQLEFGCQFPHQCGHRERPCAAACPNNPVPPVEKKRPARKVTTAKKANRMPPSNYHTVLGADGRKACVLKRRRVPPAGWRAARRRAKAWRQFLKQKEQDGLKGTQAERRSAARNAHDLKQ